MRLKGQSVSSRLIIGELCRHTASIKARRNMRNKAYLPFLMLVIVGSMASHISLTQADNGNLLVIDGKEYDFLGGIANRWVAITRSCRDVVLLRSQDSHYARVEQLIKAYSPPSSHSARIAGMWSYDGWTVVETEFDDLLPAVVSLKTMRGELVILPQAVWSGRTMPWVAAPLIRGYLARQAPEMPAVLLNCFEPRSAAFK